MAPKSGDIVKLYRKNIHISARNKHFKELAEDGFILVRVERVEQRGEGRQKKHYATVTFPGERPEGVSIVWEGIAKLKNLQLVEVPDADGAAPGAAQAVDDHSDVDPDQEVSDGDDSVDHEFDEEPPDASDGSNLRAGWKWAPCTIDERNSEELRHKANHKMYDMLDRDMNAPIHYFIHYLFMDYISEQLLPHINTAFKEDEHVTSKEMYGWLAVLIAKSQWGLPDEVFWTLPIGQKLSAIMDHSRFKAIWKAMDPSRADWGDPSDPHRHVSPIIEAFNAHMLNVDAAGPELCLDESMLLWLGKIYLLDGWVVHERKPDPSGYEFKAVCDVSTNAMLRVELCGSEKNKFVESKKFFSECRSRKIAQIMRLLEPWFHTGRSVTADSGFGSPMAVAMLREKGLFSCMMIKKARYWPQYVPNDIISKLSPEFDSVISCSKRIQTPSENAFKVTLTAHRDMHPRLYCHSLSVSVPISQPFLMYKRMGEKGRTVLQLREVQPPQVGLYYSRTRNAVDLFNGHRKRPNTELVEAVYCSNPCQKILLFILSCIETNAKIMWANLTTDDKDDWWTFRTLLVDSLIHVASVEVGTRRKRQMSPAPLARHYLLFTSDMSEQDKDLIWPNGRPSSDKTQRGRCHMCKKICHSVCNCCRTKWLCKRICFSNHVAEVMNVETLQ